MEDNGFCSSETHFVHKKELYAVDSPVRFYIPEIGEDLSYMFPHI